MLGTKTWAAIAAFGMLAALGEAQGTIYRLEGGSALEQGCLAPCMCAFPISGNAQGTFLLQLESLTQFSKTYTVDHVNWTVIDGANERHAVRGSGTYFRSTNLVGDSNHQLTLNLSFDGGPSLAFDSGLQPDPGEFPAIDLTLTDGSTACVTNSLRVKTEPPPPTDVTRFKLDKTLFQEGCFPPCKCALFLAQRVGGTFDLVLVASDGFTTEFSVADVNWTTGPNSFSSKKNVRVDGIGTYTYMDALAPPPTVQMTLELTFDGNSAAPFSSGPVSAPFMDGIHLILSQNGVFCVDHLFDLHAFAPPLVPIPLVEAGASLDY